MQKITTNKFTYQNLNLPPEKLVPNQTQKTKKVTQKKTQKFKIRM
ncbi:hypothetical protein [Mesomycoplasma ovipneumoniae]